MCEIELLDQIKQKLDQTRNLAIEAGGFTLFYLIEMALLETKEMSKKPKRVGEATDESDGLRAH